MDENLMHFLMPSLPLMGREVTGPGIKVVETAGILKKPVILDFRF